MLSPCAITDNAFLNFVLEFLLEVISFLKQPASVAEIAFADCENLVQTDEKDCY